MLSKIIFLAKAMFGIRKGIMTSIRIAINVPCITKINGRKKKIPVT